MKLNREILRLAIPSILANITVPLVGMVDIAVVGHLGSTEGFSGAAFIGGISVGAMLFDLLYWNFAFLRAGTGGLTAQAYGRLGAKNGSFAPESGKKGVTGAESALFAPEICDILGRALRIALLSGLALIALQWVVVQAAFLVVDCTPEVRMLATRYFYIRIWAAPATLSLFALKGWFIGLQDTFRPMLVDLWINLCNILLSLGLGFGLSSGSLVLLPEMGFAGVAWGTAIAQWTGLLLALCVARKYLPLSHLLKVLVQFSNEESQEFADTERVSDHGEKGARVFFALNRDLFLRSVGMIAVYIGFTVLSARLGDQLLAVSAILMKLLMLFSYFTDGFAYAGEALTGRFIGERSLDGVRSTVRGTFAWSFALAGAFMLLYGLGGTPLLKLMTSDASVVEAGRTYLPWLLLMPLIGCPAFAWDGIFIGATASKDLRNSTLLCAVGFFAVWFAGSWLADGSLHLLMAAYFVHLAIRAFYLTVRYKPSVLSLLS
ncbi:MAG: MATE family efflux transporter [Bacteroidales bacterium]|nr:MATE family efflux transporter [Bacteroidales bacterium]